MNLQATLQCDSNVEDKMRVHTFNLPKMRVLTFNVGKMEVHTYIMGKQGYTTIFFNCFHCDYFYLNQISI